MPQICLEGVGKDYPMEHEKRMIHAVRDVDLAIEPGEFVFVTGSSGAGKRMKRQGFTWMSQSRSRMMRWRRCGTA